MTFFLFFIAGRSVQNEELENMLESGNPAIFTQGVSSRPSQMCFFDMQNITINQSIHPLTMQTPAYN